MAPWFAATVISNRSSEVGKSARRDANAKRALAASSGRRATNAVKAASPGPFRIRCGPSWSMASPSTAAMAAASSIPLLPQAICNAALA
jgi:hypothetical protein